MSEEARRKVITRAAVVYEIPGMDEVRILRDLEYLEAEDGARTMDVYLPPDPRPETRAPVVILVSGYPDPGYEAALGCRFKEMQWCTSWGRLLAASGLAAVAYSNRDPVADLDALLAHLGRQAASLGLDEKRMGLWACSGNVPMALSVLMRQASHAFRCAALCYGFMLDLEGSTRTADAAARFGFVDPCADRSVEDLPRELPLFLGRAGKDEMPGLNETIDLFVVEALAHDLPMTLVNLAGAPHAFDLWDDRASSRDAIQRILAFLQLHLLA